MPTFAIQMEVTERTHQEIDIEASSAAEAVRLVESYNFDNSYAEETGRIEWTVANVRVRELTPEQAAVERVERLEQALDGLLAYFSTYERDYGFTEDKPLIPFQVAREALVGERYPAPRTKEEAAD